METIIQNHHFTLTRVRPIPDLNGKLWELEHPASGAKLAWIDRPEENMTFSIGFTTIPEDSTGVFHILEHSVLCGSDKYPVKEPFVELLKSSLQTFLNAMTFPDKTMYPVSSRNKQDFLNLVSVYMDAVLHPAIHHKKDIFLQEGWRYEEGVYQGVVYNEMKGAYASVGNAMERQMEQHLFPDNCYRHDSGGDPEHIPELTYEQFLACHEKFYHPSNALIVLDGQVELGSVLALLDEYLKDYERREIHFSIPLQQQVPYHEVSATYAIGEEEDPSGKTFITRGKLLGTYADRELHMAAELLEDYLSDGNEAPLKRAILDAGLGADFHVGLHDGIQQSWFGWQVQNTEAKHLPAIKETIRATVEKILAQGLDRERMEAYLSSMAFSLTSRDGGGYRGVYEAINVMSSWLYGGDPALYLTYSEALESLRSKLDTDYYADLLRDCLLDETNGVLVVLEPSTTLGAENRAEEERRLEKAWNAMTEAQQRTAEAEAEALSLWQRTPDSPEALATIPVLKLSDLPEKPTLLQTRLDSCNGVPVLRQQLDSQLVYLSVHFAASDLKLEELSALGVLCRLLGKLPTTAHDTASLKLAQLKTFGELEITPNVYDQTPDSCTVCLSAHFVCLKERQEEAVKLLTEILTETLYNKPTLLREHLLQQRHRFRRALISSGNRFAMTRVQARHCSMSVAKEHLSGCEYLRWLNENADGNDDAMNALLARMEGLARKLCTVDRLTIQASEAAGEDTIALVSGSFPVDGVKAPGEVAYPLLPMCAEGIEIPSDVAYAAQGGNMKRVNLEGSGSMYALGNILSYSYLWNAIRVQGGAYGASFLGAPDSAIFFSTYRDPNPARSLDCFADTAAFVKEFCAGGEDLDRYILGAVSDLDPMRSAGTKFRAAIAYHFRNIGPERHCRQYTELLRTTPDELLRIMEGIQRALDGKNICVVGGKPHLEQCGDRLNTVLKLLG